MTIKKNILLISVSAFIAILALLALQTKFLSVDRFSSLFYQNRKSATPKITIHNSYNTRQLKINNSHFALPEISSSLTQFQLSTLDQKITINSGLPEGTYGTFFAAGAPVSASKYSLNGNEITIEIFLSEDLEEKYFIYEISRNYFWALLALDEYLKKSGTYSPTYDAQHEKTYALTRKSADTNDYPFVDQSK